MGWSQPYKEHFLSLNLMVKNYPGTEIWDPDVPWHLNPRVLSVAHMVSEGGGCTGKPGRLSLFVPPLATPQDLTWRD